MATQITKWEANDGTLHNSERDADMHDERKALVFEVSREIHSLFAHGDVDDEELLEALNKGTLGELVYLLKLHDKNRLENR
jgi:hypothetical protein